MNEIRKILNIIAKISVAFLLTTAIHTVDYILYSEFRVGGWSIHYNALPQGRTLLASENLIFVFIAIYGMAWIPFKRKVKIY